MPHTKRGIENLENLCLYITAINLNERLYELGKLIGQSQVDETDSKTKMLGAIFSASDQTLREQIVTEGFYRRFHDTIASGVSDATIELPNHVVIPGPLPEIGEQTSSSFAEAVIRALPAGALYRSGQEIGQILGDPGQRYFKPCSTDDIRLIVDRNIRLSRWVTQKSGGSVLRYVPCNRDLAGLIIAAAQQHYLIRDIKMLTCYPVFTGQGLTQPGWADGYYYDEPGELSPLDLDERPADPLDVLYDLTFDFPFASEADRHNFIGLLITPLIRPSLNGNVPLHLIMASRERTGKSKLAEEILGGVILGRKTPAIQLTGDDAEIEKRITAKLRYGGTIWHIDNLKEHIDSPALASLITASAWEGRVLGSSTLIGLANNLTIVGTGNNVRATLELVERTVPIFLQPKTEDPSQRDDFIHPDLAAYVSANRKKILSTLLWMVLDWQRSPDSLDSLGRPGGGSRPSKRRLGGFERWAATVGGILEHHGFTEWLANQREWVKQGDPHSSDLRELITAWGQIHGNAKISTKAIMDIASSASLFEDIQGKTPGGRLISFSRRVLRRRQNCPVDTESGTVILRAKSSGSNSQWWLEGGNFSLVNKTAEETF